MRKFIRALRHLHIEQKGMTGLETAIILIAFVTVTSVLSFSVLSAGIFSAEKAKETVYKGLEKADNALELSSNVLGLSPNQTRLESVVFFIRLAVPSQKVDVNSININYFDKGSHYEDCDSIIRPLPGRPERGHIAMIEQDEQFRVTVTIPDNATAGAYDSFTIQVVTSVSESFTLTRTLPPVLKPVMDLN